MAPSNVNTVRKLVQLFICQPPVFPERQEGLGGHVSDFFSVGLTQRHEHFNAFGGLQALQGQTSCLLELEVCLRQRFTVIEQGLFPEMLISGGCGQVKHHSLAHLAVIPHEQQGQGPEYFLLGREAAGCEVIHGLQQFLISQRLQSLNQGNLLGQLVHVTLEVAHTVAGKVTVILENSDDFQREAGGEQRLSPVQDLGDQGSEHWVCKSWVFSVDGSGEAGF